MIQVELHRDFVKPYDKRIKGNLKLAVQVERRTELFRINPKDEILRNHQLVGKKRGFWSFSVTGDIRVIYYLKSKELAVFMDIGSHNQVY